uniref:Uncharacterized protein n=1 Tax=Anguilla anguilla TaxID=7936 RepID=A0A0E9UC18_ANGAN
MVRLNGAISLDCMMCCHCL